MRHGAELTWPLEVYLVCGGDVSVGASQIDGRNGSRRIINGVIKDTLCWGIPPHHEGLKDERIDTANTLHNCLNWGTQHNVQPMVCPPSVLTCGG